MMMMRTVSMTPLLGITGVIPCPTTIWMSSEVSCPGAKEQNHCWAAPGVVGMDLRGIWSLWGWSLWGCTPSDREKRGSDPLLFPCSSCLRGECCCQHSPGCWGVWEWDTWEPLRLGGHLVLGADWTHPNFCSGCL